MFVRDETHEFVIVQKVNVQRSREGGVSSYETKKYPLIGWMEITPNPGTQVLCPVGIKHGVINIFGQIGESGVGMKWDEYELEPVSADEWQRIAYTKSG